MNCRETATTNPQQKPRHHHFHNAKAFLAHPEPERDDELMLVPVHPPHAPQFHLADSPKSVLKARSSTRLVSAQ